MSHWDVVWICFGLTFAVLLFDFWQAHQAARSTRERLLMADDDVAESGLGLSTVNPKPAAQSKSSQV